MIYKAQYSARIEVFARSSSMKMPIFVTDFSYEAIRCLLAKARSVFSTVRRLYRHVARFLRIVRLDGYHRHPVEMEEGRLISFMTEFWSGLRSTSTQCVFVKVPHKKGLLCFF